MGTQLFQSKDEALEKLKSDNPTDRRRAIEYLKEFINDDDRVLPALQMVAKNDQNKVIRYLASEALGAKRTINIASTTSIEGREQITELDLLAKLVEIQLEQNKALSEIKKHTGCIYAYLIISVILGILLGVPYFLGFFTSF